MHARQAVGNLGDARSQVSALKVSQPHFHLYVSRGRHANVLRVHQSWLQGHVCVREGMPSAAKGPMACTFALSVQGQRPSDLHFAVRARVATPSHRCSCLISIWKVLARSICAHCM